MNGEVQHKYIFFLGTHPALSRLEIERVLAARGLSPTTLENTEEYLLIALDAPLNAQLQDVLGGSDRFALELGRFPEVPAGEQIGQLLSPTSGVGNKKINIGLSGLGIDGDQLRRLGEDLKEWWIKRGGKLRYVVPQGQAERLNAAQVMAHKLDKAPHAELTLVKLQSGEVGVYKTIAVQDIGAYELRDTQRPVRDAHVGLLPPKLAQIMLNLAFGAFSLNREKGGMRVLDPFAGMGTILQEGLLMDYKMTGSDASEKMVQASEKNLVWLQSHFKVDESLAPRVFVHQANTKWSSRWHGVFDAVVTEPFLGKPLRKPLPQAQLEAQMNELGDLYRRVFSMLRAVLKEDGVVVFALPAFRMERGGDEWQFFPQRFLDALEHVGYSKQQLGNYERADMLYARPNALVGRELTVWRKKAG